MADKLEFETRATWDIITDEINDKLNEYAKSKGVTLTEDNIEDYRITVKIELSLF